MTPNIGDSAATDRLLPLVYDALRRVAAAKLAHEKPGNTLQPTALVYESDMRLMGAASQQDWDSTRHLFAAASEAMRRVLVEQAHRKKRLKRGGDPQREDLQVVATKVPNEELLALDEALSDFASEHPDKAELVKLLYFGGMTVPQGAEVEGSC